MGVTILLLTCSYKGEEFVRVGYYVNIEVANPELLDPNNPNAITGQPSIDQLQRNIMAGKLNQGAMLMVASYVVLRHASTV